MSDQLKVFLELAGLDVLCVTVMAIEWSDPLRIVQFILVVTLIVYNLLRIKKFLKNGRKTPNDK